MHGLPRKMLRWVQRHRMGGLEVGGQARDMWAWFCKSSGRWYVGPEWFLGTPGGFLRAEDRGAATPHAITATWELSCAATSSAVTPDAVQAGTWDVTLPWQPKTVRSAA